MQTLKLRAQKLMPGIVTAVCCLVAGSCTYEVPITANPTRKIEVKLLGDWVSSDGKDKMKVRKLDDFVYIVSYGGDLFRAYHSDVGKTALVSVQDIDSSERKYVYLTWKLSDDGKELGLRAVNTKVVPKETKDSASVQKLLEKNLQNPDLFEEEGKFTREK
jgi:hypothetical protein